MGAARGLCRLEEEDMALCHKRGLLHASRTSLRTQAAISKDLQCVTAVQLLRVFFSAWAFGRVRETPSPTRGSTTRFRGQRNCPPQETHCRTVVVAAPRVVQAGSVCHRHRRKDLVFEVSLRRVERFPCRGTVVPLSPRCSNTGTRSTRGYYPQVIKCALAWEEEADGDPPSRLRVSHVFQSPSDSHHGCMYAHALEP